MGKLYRYPRWKDSVNFIPHWAKHRICIPSEWAWEVLNRTGAFDSPRFPDAFGEREAWERALKNYKVGRGFGVTLLQPTWKSPPDWTRDARLKAIQAWRRVFIAMMDRRQENKKEHERVRRRLMNLNLWWPDDIITQLAALDSGTGT